MVDNTKDLMAAFGRGQDATYNGKRIAQAHENGKIRLEGQPEAFYPTWADVILWGLTAQQAIDRLFTRYAIKGAAYYPGKDKNGTFIYMVCPKTFDQVAMIYTTGPKAGSIFEL